MGYSVITALVPLWPSASADRSLSFDWADGDGAFQYFIYEVNFLRMLIFLPLLVMISIFLDIRH